MSALFDSSEAARLQQFLDTFDRPPPPNPPAVPQPSYLPPSRTPQIPQVPFGHQPSEVHAALAARLAGVAELDDDKRKAQTEALTSWLAGKGFTSAPLPARALSQAVPPSPHIAIQHPQQTPYGLVTPTQSQHSFGSPVSPPARAFPAAGSQPTVKPEPDQSSASLLAADPKGKAPAKKRKVADKRKSEVDGEPGPSSGRTATGLLSEEQKRANHIASEQKRRLAIRQGYDALCEVVPALRAAVQEFEDRLATTRRGRGIEEDEEVDAKGKRKRAAADDSGFHRGSGALTGGINVGDEKIDGRAGPKSEAVVLSKCACRVGAPVHVDAAVEYLKLTKERRSELLLRLEQARSLATQRGIAIPAPTSQSWLEAAKTTS